MIRRALSNISNQVVGGTVENPLNSAKKSAKVGIPILKTKRILSEAKEIAHKEENQSNNEIVSKSKLSVVDLLSSISEVLEHYVKPNHPEVESRTQMMIEKVKEEFGIACNIENGSDHNQPNQEIFTESRIRQMSQSPAIKPSITVSRGATKKKKHHFSLLAMSESPTKESIDSTDQKSCRIENTIDDSDRNADKDPVAMDVDTKVLSQPMEACQSTLLDGSTSSTVMSASPELLTNTISIAVTDENHVFEDDMMGCGILQWTPSPSKEHSTMSSSAVSEIKRDEKSTANISISEPVSPTTRSQCRTRRRKDDPSAHDQSNPADVTIRINSKRSKSGTTKGARARSTRKPVDNANKQAEGSPIIEAAIEMTCEAVTNQMKSYHAIYASPESDFSKCLLVSDLSPCTSNYFREFSDDIPIEPIEDMPGIMHGGYDLYGERHHSPECEDIDHLRFNAPTSALPSLKPRKPKSRRQQLSEAPAIPKACNKQALTQTEIGPAADNDYKDLEVKPKKIRGDLFQSPTLAKPSQPRSSFSSSKPPLFPSRRRLVVSSPLTAAAQVITNSQDLEKAKQIVEHTLVTNPSFSMVISSSGLTVVVWIVASWLNIDPKAAKPEAGVLSAALDVLSHLNLWKSPRSPAAEAKVEQPTSRCTSATMVTPVKSGGHIVGSTALAANHAASCNISPSEHFNAVTGRPRKISFARSDASCISPPKDDQPASWAKTRAEISRLEKLSLTLDCFISRLHQFNSSLVEELSTLCHYWSKCSRSQHENIVSTLLQHCVPMVSIANRVSKEILAVKEFCNLFLSLPTMSSNLSVLNKSTDNPAWPKLHYRQTWLRCACIRAHLRWFFDPEPESSSRKSTTMRACAASSWFKASSGSLNLSVMISDRRSGVSSQIRVKWEMCDEDNTFLKSQILQTNQSGTGQVHFRPRRTSSMSLSCLFTQAMRQFLRGLASIEHAHRRLCSKKGLSGSSAIDKSWRHAYTAVAVRIGDDSITELVREFVSKSIELQKHFENDLLEFEELQALLIIVAGDIARQFLSALLSLDFVTAAAAAPLKEPLTESGMIGSFWNSIQQLALDEKKSNGTHIDQNDGHPFHYNLLSLSLPMLLNLLQKPLAFPNTVDLGLKLANDLFQTFSSEAAPVGNDPVPCGRRRTHKSGTSESARALFAPSSEECIASVESTSEKLHRELNELPVAQQLLLLRTQHNLIFEFPSVSKK